MKDREFISQDRDGNDITVVFKKPTQSQITSADFTFKKAFAEGVRAGLITQAEAVKILKAQGVWGDAQEDEAASLRTKITEIETKFNANLVSVDEGKALYDEIKMLRDKLTSLVSLITSVTENTVESYASDVKTKFYIVECCINKATNKKLFQSITDFNNQFPDKLTSDCYRKSLIVIMEAQIGIELPETLSEDSAEDKWLAEAIVKDVEEEVEKPKSKGRKKKQPASV